MEYRREIDGLRALAVVPVILFHAKLHVVSGGFVGVDVFFVISGYLITSIILAEKEAGAFTFLGFYERRARRILPALFVVLLACLPFAWQWLLPVDMKNFSQSLASVTVFASNLFFYLKGGYFDTASDLKPLLHTWSLAVEEQYYVVFPAFLVLALKFGRCGFLSLLVTAAIASLIAAHWGSASQPNAAFFLLPTRAWELLLGVFAAYWSQGRTLSGSNLASGLGLLLILYGIFGFDTKTPSPSIYTLIPTIGALLVIVFARNETLVGKILSCKPLVGVGLASYSAYLWHQPLLAFTRYRTVGDPASWKTSAAIIATGGLAYLSWRFVESPFRDRRRFTRKQIFVYSGLCSATLLAFGLAGHLSNGFPKRGGPDSLPNNYFEMASNARYPMRGTDGRLCVSEMASACLLNSVSGAKTVLLVGDSHSADYSIEFRRYVADSRITAWQLSIYGCAFLPSQFNRYNGECGRARHLLKELLASVRPDVIFFVVDLYGHTAGSDKTSLATDMDSLSDLVRDISDSGTELIFFSPRHTLSDEPTRAAMAGELSNVSVANPSYGNYIDERLRLLSMTKNFTLFNERDYLLGLGSGLASSFNGHTRNLEPLYIDTNHLTNFGARQAFQELERIRGSAGIAQVQ